VSWSELTDWWLSEVSSDPAYATVVTPLLLEVLEPESGKLYLDVGCGEGRVMRAISDSGAKAHGVDINPDLASRAGKAVVADLLSLPLKEQSYDGVYSVLTLEHIPDHGPFFEEMARVTRPNGTLAIVVNHPIWTAPRSTPISDSDGEVLWRPGDYFSDETVLLPAGDAQVVFHHRTMASLLNGASEGGWGLEHMIEQPHHEFDDQRGIPRLLACRWRRG
jgi:SAM-dependent methyltransferase